MAWWVVMGHISLTFGWNLPIIDQNTLAVDVFVILSGFVITKLIKRKREPYREYLIRRGFRLFPLYLIVLFISAALLPVQLEAWHSASVTPQNISRINLANIALSRLPFDALTHFPLLQGAIPETVAPGSSYTIVGQAWSISLEWQFYVLAPAIVWMLARRKRLPLLLVLTGALILAKPYFGSGFLGSKILLFYVGMLSYLLLTQHGNRSLYAFLTVASSIGIFVLGNTLQAVPLVIWAAVIVSTMLPKHSPILLLSKALSWRPIFHMGDITYSIYLVHMIPLYGSLFVLNRFDIIGLDSQVVIAITTVVLTYVLAIASYRWIETPGIAVGYKVSRPKKLTPGAPPFVV